MGLELHAVEAVVDVFLVLLRGTVPWVGVAHQGHVSVQGSAELHGLGRGMRERCCVHRTPWIGPGVVTEEAGATEQLFLDGGRRGLQIDKVSDDSVGQHGEEPGVDVVGQLLADEFCVVVRGAVAPFQHGGVFLLLRPVGVGGVHRHSVVAPLAEQSGGGVVDVVEVLGEVGLATEGGDEFLPGGGGLELGGELQN